MRYTYRTMNKKLSIELSPELHRKLKQVALDRDTTIRALIIECASHVVETATQEKGTRHADTDETD